MTEKMKKRMEYLVPAAAVTLVFIGCMCAGGFYFSSNDDALLADILSGAYSGKPDAHDIYHLYPLALLLSLLYKIAPAVPWYGGFLVLAQLVCLYLVGRRCMECARKFWGRMAAAAAGILFCAALLMSELRLLQYTMTSAILAATAVFLLVTDTKRRYATVIILYTAAFLLRMQMGLLLLPFFLVACLFRWLCSGEKKRAFRQYLSVAGILFGTLAVCYLIHAIAYGSSEWKEFEDFNQVRTQIYDYGGRLPEYESHAEFYEGISVSEAEQYLLETYSFSLSDKWDTELLEAVSVYQKELDSYRYSFRNLLRALRTVLTDYVLTTASPSGWILYIAAALFLMLCAAGKKKGVFLCSMSAFFLAHMVCWGYLVLNQRMPERVTNGLYLAETALLVGICVSLFGQGEGKTRVQRRHDRLLTGVLYGIPVVGIVVLTAVKLPDVRQTTDGARRYAQCNTKVQEYCMANEDSLYVLDTISFASIKEKIATGEHAENVLLCGAWTTNSPLYRQKLMAQLGEGSLEQGLSSGRMCFIIEKGRDTGWLENYLAEKGLCLRLQEEIVTGTGNDYLVYDMIAEES